MIWYDSRARRNRQTIADRLTAAEPQALAAPSLPPELAAELQHRILGEVVLPGDPAYDAARRLANPRFSACPQAIVFCEVEADVRECLSVAQRAGLAVVVRSGGHSTGGFSANDGLLLDVSRIDDVCVDTAA
ncbi:MAG TPA: FAD-binding protein, partial [Paracoccaceae bacterium]